METLEIRIENLEMRLENLEEKINKPSKYEKPLDNGKLSVAKPKVSTKLSVAKPKVSTKLSVAKPKVSMDLYKSGILVTGSTFAIKNTLMENGGKWNKSLNGWMFTKSHLDEVIEGLTEEEIELTIGEGVIYGVNIHPRNIQK
jgi:hypothetical protein